MAFAIIKLGIKNLTFKDSVEATPLSLQGDFGRIGLDPFAVTAVLMENLVQVKGKVVKNYRLMITDAEGNVVDVEIPKLPSTTAQFCSITSTSNGKPSSKQLDMFCKADYFKEELELIFYQQIRALRSNMPPIKRDQDGHNLTNGQAIYNSFQRLKKSLNLLNRKIEEEEYIKPAPLEPSSPRLRFKRFSDI